MSILTRRVTALVAVGALTTGLSACGGSDSAGADADTVTIGFVGALTGPLAASGKNSLAGLKAGAEYAEKKFGVTVEIKQRDTKGEPTAAVAATRALAQDGVTAMYFTTEAFPAVQDVLNQVKVPGDTAGGIGSILDEVGDSKRYKYAFSTGAGTAGPTSIRPVLEQAKANGGRIGMLSVGSAYGTAQEEQTLELAESDFPELDIATEQFPETATDVTAQLNKLKDAGAETVIVWGYGAPLVAVLNGFAKTGWAPPTISAGLASGESGARDLIPDSMKETLIAGPLAAGFVAETEGQKPQGAAAAFEEIYMADQEGEFDALDTVGAISFDWAVIVAQAVDAAGSNDPQKVKDKLVDGTEFEGANGTYRFGPDTRIGIGLDDLSMFVPAVPCDAGTCLAVPASQ